MAWKKNENREEMYEMYLRGYSLAEVAKFYGKTRQSVYELFKNHNMPCRKKIMLPVVEFNGNKYTIRNTGYYGKTYGDRSLLHRDMWEFHKGKIPDGWDIHHIDGIKTNNVMENLQCISKAEHASMATHGQNQHTKAKRIKCGS